MSEANPNQPIIDALNGAIANLDKAEAQLDAAVTKYQQQLDTVTAATKSAIAAATAQKATYEAQEKALRDAVTALGG